MQPLKLVPADTLLDQPPGQALVVAWGRGTALDTEETGRLQDLKVDIVSQTSCEADYKNNTINENVVCAGEVDATTCYGDSGGPLIVDNGGDYQAIGIASLNDSCVVPGVFSRVSAYIPWLNGLPGD